MVQTVCLQVGLIKQWWSCEKQNTQIFWQLDTFDIYYIKTFFWVVFLYIYIYFFFLYLFVLASVTCELLFCCCCCYSIVAIVVVVVAAAAIIAWPSCLV